MTNSLILAKKFRFSRTKNYVVSLPGSAHHSKMQTSHHRMMNMHEYTYKYLISSLIHNTYTHTAIEDRAMCLLEAEKRRGNNNNVYNIIS